MRRYIIWLIVFAALEIALALYLTVWREHFWNAVSSKEQLQFLQQLAVFTGVALSACFISGFSGYLVALTAIKWRQLLNEKALQFQSSCAENVNQRIQEDCMSYPDLVLNLLFGVVKALFYIIVFSTSLILSFDWWYLLILVLYATIGSFFLRYIANPLIILNYEQQRAEATYRNNLTCNNFNDCVIIMLGLAKKQKHLTYLQQFYSQVGVVIPLIIIAPVYFTSGMSLGLLMRFNSLSSTIFDNLSYGATNFSLINKLLSCRKRLKELTII